MAATGCRAIDGAGDGVYLAAGFECKICGDERAGAARAFDHKKRTRPMSDDTISLRKGFAVRRGLKRELGDDSPMAIGDFFGKSKILRWINLH